MTLHLLNRRQLSLERAMSCFARNSCWFKLFELLLPYLRFSWDSLDFLSPFGRTIISASLRARRLIFRVSVSIRARLWLVYILAFWAEISTI